MFTIDLTDFNRNELLSSFQKNENNVQSTLSNHMYEGGSYSMKIIVNGKEVINNTRHMYILYTTLQSINNAFYKLLTGDKKAVITFDLGSGRYQEMSLTLSGYKLFFTTLPNRFLFDCDLKDEQVSLLEASAIVFLVIHEYREVFIWLSTTLLANNPSAFLDQLFSKNWLPLYEAWRKYRKQGYRVRSNYIILFNHIRSIVRATAKKIKRYLYIKRKNKFKIDLTDFSRNELLSLFQKNDEKWQDTLSCHMYYGDTHSISIIVNGKEVITNIRHTYILYTTLQSINNAFYKLLNGDKEAVMTFDLGSGGHQEISLKLSGTNVFFSTVDNRFLFDYDLIEEPVPFLEACSEVVKVIHEYREVYMWLSKILLANNSPAFLDQLFSKNWLPLEEAWGKYKEQGNK